MKTAPRQKAAPACRRNRTPSFILDLPMRVDAVQADILQTRLDAARQVCNAALDASLRRLDLLRESRDWRRARKMDKGPARTRAFRDLARAAGFTQYDIQKVAERCRDACWIGDHLGSHDTQTTARRAFQAAQQYGFGKRGRPRMKGHGRLRSIEGKGDAVILLRWRETPRTGASAVGPQPAEPFVAYRGLEMPLVIDRDDPAAYEARALAARTKFVRIVRRTVRGRELWYAQLVEEGQPPRRRETGPAEAVVSLDIGPSEIAMVSAGDATLTRFCPKVLQIDAETRRLRRALDRSRRATNPQCYNADGTWKRGTKQSVFSTRYIRIRAELADAERRLAAERKRAHGELSNRALGPGCTIKTEKLSYRSFQKRYGRSTKRSGAGMFVSTLTRKAESAGGGVIAISTRKTRLSQACHISGDYVKKPLSQRYHEFPDGSRVQRDLYSAYLAGCVEANRLDLSHAARGWARAEPLPRRAEIGRRQAASGTDFALPRAIRPMKGPEGVGAVRA